MKKILTLVCSLMLGMGLTQAQVSQGQTAVGANLLYGSWNESLGAGIRFQYGIIDRLRAEVGVNHYFGRKHRSCWDVNLNAHYLLNVSNERFYFYPLAGINYTMTNDKRPTQDHPKGKGESNHIGINVGAGLEFEINEHFGANLEYRHTIIRKVDQGVVGLGVNYKF